MHRLWLRPAPSIAAPQRKTPYRDSAAVDDPRAPASVHECGDIIVRVHAGVGPTSIRLDPKTAEVRYEPRLHELSTPLFLSAFLFGASEAGGFMLLSRTFRGVPAGAFQALWLPAVVFVIAMLGLFDPAARRVQVSGATRCGQRIVAKLAFPTMRSAKRFVRAAEEAIAPHLGLPSGEVGSRS